MEINDTYVYTTRNGIRDGMFGVGKVTGIKNDCIIAVEDSTNGNCFMLNNHVTFAQKHDNFPDFIMVVNQAKMWYETVDVNTYDRLKKLIRDIASVYVSNIVLNEIEIDFLKTYYSKGYRIISVGVNKIAMRHRDSPINNYEFKMFRRFSVAKFDSLTIGAKYDIRTLLCYAGEQSLYKCKEHGQIKINKKKEYNNFIDDIEKMSDFFELSKKEFLNSYSYMSEKEYDNTNAIVLKELDNATELCSSCGCETQMRTMLQRCNLCGEWQVCCSMCSDSSKCNECIISKLAKGLNKLNIEKQ